MGRSGGRAGDERARRAWTIGWGLALVGGFAGLIAVLMFTRSYLSSAYPDLRLTSDLFTVEILMERVGGFPFLVLLAAGFLLSGVLALAAAIRVSSRLYGSAILVLGIILAAVGFLGSYSVGGYTIYAAVAVLAGGTLRVLMSWSRSSQST